MFQSATLKLTGWYLGILMLISILFSVAIYQLNFHEVNMRLENLQRGIVELNILPGINIDGDQVRLIQSHQASQQMILTLLYINIGIFACGGVGSYLLARRTLRPLERSLEAQSRFTSDASHELRTPLAAMKTEIEVALMDKNLPSHEAREQLESNLEEVNKLIALSEMLLKLARLDHDALERTTVSLHDVIESAAKRFPQFQDRIEISGKKQYRALGNEPAMEEVATILIDNALKYSADDTKVTIAIIERRMMTGFSVTNQGQTIPIEQQAKIFQRFYREDTSRTKSDENGYGLGLAIAQKIMEIHQGTITVTSKNGTTTFTCLFPPKRATQAQAE